MKKDHHEDDLLSPRRRSNWGGSAGSISGLFWYSKCDMPYSDVDSLPDAFSKKSPAIKARGLTILNGLLRTGMDESKAIRIALSRAQDINKESEEEEGIEEVGQTAMGKKRGFSKQRADQLQFKAGYKGRRAVKNGLKTGKIKKPATCKRCGKHTSDLEAHHPDYRRPLRVDWYCPKCHAQVHPHAPGDHKSSSAKNKGAKEQIEIFEDHGGVPMYFGPILMEKADANYREAELDTYEDPVDPCCECRYFRYGTCSIVEGHIEPSYTCDQWDDLLPSQQDEDDDIEDDEGE